MHANHCFLAGNLQCFNHYHTIKLTCITKYLIESSSFHHILYQIQDLGQNRTFSEGPCPFIFKITL